MIFIFLMPPDIKRVTRLTIMAQAAVTEADGMMVSIEIKGGIANAPADTVLKAAAATLSETLNFTQWDVIRWVVTAGLDPITADMLIQVKCLYNAASGANCATTATFSHALMEVET